MSKLERFKNRKTNLYVPTKESYDRLMAWCDDNGILTYAGEKATDLKVWGYYDELVIYHRDVKGLQYGSFEYCTKQEYPLEILYTNDFDNNLI